MIDAEIQRNLLPVDMLNSYHNQSLGAASTFGKRRGTYDQQTERQMEAVWNTISEMLAKTKSSSLGVTGGLKFA